MTASVCFEIVFVSTVSRSQWIPMKFVCPFCPHCLANDWKVVVNWIILSPGSFIYYPYHVWPYDAEELNILLSKLTYLWVKSVTNMQQLQDFWWLLKTPVVGKLWWSHSIARSSFYRDRLISLQLFYLITRNATARQTRACVNRCAASCTSVSAHLKSRCYWL